MQHEGTGSLVLYVPEYGPIEAVLGYGFFYYLVAVGTPVVQAAVVDSALGFTPGQVGTAAAWALWIVLALSGLGQATEQWRNNPRRFEDRAAARVYLEAIAPTAARMQGWALVLLVGLIVVVFGFEPFLESYRALLAAMVRFVGTPGGARAVVRSLPWFILYTIGFSLVTRYTDRLLLGWGRRRRVERDGV